VKEYEAIFIVRPDLEEKDLDKSISGINSMIAKEGGKVIKEEKWGKKFLAYPIRKYREGVYHKVDFDAEPDKISTLKREYSLNLDVLRTMIVRREA